MEYKTSAMTGLGWPVSVGIGNCATDIEAYSAVGVDGIRTFIKLHEFTSEVEASIDSGDAIGVTSHDDLSGVSGSF